MSKSKFAGQDAAALAFRRGLQWTVYGLWILLFTVLQATPHALPVIGGARPLLVVPLTVFIAMYNGPIGGAAAGIAGGLLWDVFADRLLGFNALLLLFIGCACGLLVRLILRNNLLTAMLLSLAALLLQGLCDWLFNSVLLLEEGTFQALVRVVLPNLLYSLLLSPLLYGLIHLTYKGLRRKKI